MTKGERTYERTYVHYYVPDKPCILSKTSLCEGIIKAPTVKIIFASFSVNGSTPK